MRKLVLLAVLVSGCALDLVDRDPGAPGAAPAGLEAAETRALRIVWHDVYGMPMDSTDTYLTYTGPSIYWHTGDTCGGMANWFAAPDGSGYGPSNCEQGIFHASHGVDGVPFWEDTTYAHPNGVDVEWFDTFSSTCFAHELAHARQQYLSGDSDGDHKGTTFGDSSTCSGGVGSLVERANIALRTAGL